jgi:hypothetical protein
MKMHLRSLTLILVFLAGSTAAFATSAADVVKAQVILSKVLEFTSKYQAYAADVQAPAPITNNSGKFLIPYTPDGQLTEWATKTLSTQVGAAIGAKAGEEAGKHLAAKVPFGGLASGLVKKKGKEMGAVAAIGGMDFIKQTSSLSFNNLDDYAVYLHVTHANSGGYAQALAAAMAIYPSLEKGYDAAVKKAYQQAKRTK